MTNPRVRCRLALIAVAFPVLLVSCTKKEEPPPVAPQAPPTAAPSTTPPPPTPAPTPVPTPPPTWRTARWGMTRAQVLAAFPGEAQRLDRPTPLVKPQPGSILGLASSDVSIPKYEADGATFRVLFAFASAGLNRVHLSAIRPGIGTCGDLEKALTDRHSTPPERRPTGDSLKGEEILWTQPDQTIVLGCAGMASLGFATVTLDYLAPDAVKP
jgi:hypothetical protein